MSVADLTRFEGFMYCLGLPIAKLFRIRIMKTIRFRYSICRNSNYHVCMMLAYLVAKGHKPHVMVVRTREGGSICEVKDLKMSATGSVTIWPLRSILGCIM